MRAGTPRLAAVTVATVLAGWLGSKAALAQSSPSAPEPRRGATAGDSWNNPAKAADPPLIPPPMPAAPPPAPPAPGADVPAPDAPPISTSGTDLGGAPAPAPPAIVLSDREEDTRQDGRLQSLEERAARDEARIRSLEERLGFLRHLRVGAYVQPQFLTQSFNTAASPNLQPNGLLPAGVTANDTVARSDGTTTNSTFFRVRRARLYTTYETAVMRLFLQFDGLPEGGVGPGIGTILRNAEATGIAHWTPDVRTELTAGLFLTPFRRELLELSLDRPFIERTWFVQNVFPTERDYGVHARTLAMGDHLVFDLALVNGQGLGEKTFVALPDLNRSKDAIAYLAYRSGVLTVGASGYVGRNQLIDTTALRFKQFSKWAVNYEAALDGRVIRRLGNTRLSAELTIGSNMDTGAIYTFALPRMPAVFTDAVTDLHERALYVRVEQDLGKRVTAGYRYDMYTPDTAIKNDARDTHAFLLVGKVSRNLRWMNELGWAFDNVHPDASGPPSKHIVYFSSVLQAMF